MIVDYNDVIQSKTCQKWLSVAVDRIDLLLIDHAHCERKAAQNAMTLIFKFPHMTEMVMSLSKIVREEMVHFEQVLRLLKKNNMSFRALKSGGYAASLAQAVNHETTLTQLVDQLLIAAIIEARSCERLGLLAPMLPDTMSGFYAKLHQAEARHCKTFIDLATVIAPNNVQERLTYLAKVEASWLVKPDANFRFHSGMPAPSLINKEYMYVNSNQ